MQPGKLGTAPRTATDLVWIIFGRLSWIHTVSMSIRSNFVYVEMLTVLMFECFMQKLWKVSVECSPRGHVGQSRLTFGATSSSKKKGESRYPRYTTTHSNYYSDLYTKCLTRTRDFG